MEYCFIIEDARTGRNIIITNPKTIELVAHVALKFPDVLDKFLQHIVDNCSTNYTDEEILKAIWTFPKEFFEE